MKRVLTSCLVVLICLTAFISGYSKGCYSYATNQDGTLTNDELDVAISSWLQSHGGNLFSPQNYRARKTYEAGLLHNFIYGDGGGYDAIRQHINGGVGGNNELKFDFDGFIIQKLNTWLNNELQNGTFGQGAELNENGMFDDGTDNTLYDGKYYNNSLITVVNTNQYNSFVTGTFPNSVIKSRGTYYLYDGYEIASHYNDNSSHNLSYLVGNRTYSMTIGRSGSSSNGVSYMMYTLAGVSVYGNSPDRTALNGYGCIFYNIANSHYYLGAYGRYSNGNETFKLYSSLDYMPTEEVNNVNINFYTNNNNNVNIYPTIVDADGHLYITPKVNVGVDGEVNYQPYIVNEGDTVNNVINQYYIDSNTPDKTISYPTDDPNDNGGGGGSTDNPSGGTPPDWSNNYPHLSPDGEGGFNFNFTLPDLNIDWNINGLTEKFPFSIPFDLIHFVEVLNAEPETPEFDWTIDLKIYQWHIDADLHQFDNLAGIVRNVEFIGFCITLVMITRKMIKG